MFQIESPSRSVSTERPKISRLIRLPPVLLDYVEAESSRCGLDAAEYVTKILDGVRTDFGLPAAARAYLDEERRSLGLEPYDYLLHTLYQRHFELRAKGIGFDARKPPRALPRVEGKP
jgi:hypothetical protein